MKKLIYLGIFIFSLYSKMLFAQATNKIDTVGNVGVGTTSPVTTLDVRGGFATISLIGTNTTYPHVGSLFTISSNQDGVGRTILATSDQARSMYFEKNGDINIPNNKLSGQEAFFTTGSFHGYTLSSDFGSDYSVGLGIGMPGISPNKGINIGYNNVADVGFIGAVQNGTGWKNLSLAPIGGYVGIGTTSPSEKLTVNGNLKGENFLAAQTGSFQGYSLSSDFGSDYSVGLGIGMPGTSPNKGINIGYNNIADVGFIGSVQNGTGWKSLSLAPIGGYVGIGTTSPAAKLDVNGNISMSANSTVRTIWNTGYGGAIQLLRSDTDANRWARLGIVDNSGNWVDGVQVSSVGKVGIGTTSPTSKLDVNGDIAMSANSTIRTIWNAGYGGAIQLLRSDADANRWARLGIVDNSGNWVSGIQVNSSGNVGIGTTSPSEKLAVNGNISSKKSIVTQTGWSDYVFNDDYKLKSLSQVEKYIKNNKHLPEIPSAKEVEEKGLDLGANQAVLLKKIEELTLYIIEQQKRIEKLEKQTGKK